MPQDLHHRLKTHFQNRDAHNRSMGAEDLDAFLEQVTPVKRARDAKLLLELMREVTGEEPKLQGTIVGFGQYHYRYESGREGDAPAAAFAPRKQASVVYLSDGIGSHEADLARLGPHTAGVGCIYLKDLDDIDFDVLTSIVRRSYQSLARDTYGLRARQGRQD